LVPTSPRLTAELIFHSDRGSQYASLDFRAVLKEHGISASMSRKGNCQDNAPAETLFGSRKVERLQGERFHLPSGQGRSPSLAALVELRTHALNAELCEFSRVRKRPKGCSDEDGRIKSAAAEAGGGNAPPPQLPLRGGLTPQNPPVKGHACLGARQPGRRGSTTDDVMRCASTRSSEF
jgi:hypothetical protein